MSGTGILMGLLVLALATAAAWWLGRLQGLTAAAAQLATSMGRVEGLQAQLDSERAAAAQRLADLRSGEGQLKHAFESLSADVLRQSNQDFLALAEQRFAHASQAAATDLEKRETAVAAMVKPLTESLSKVEKQLTEVELERAKALSDIRGQITTVTAASDSLREETQRLSNTLRAPQSRGQWGEVQLRRVVELSGMLPHCDFDEQASKATDDGVVRPDLVVRLAGDKQIVVDSKVPLLAWLEAGAASTEEQRVTHTNNHAKQLRKHVVQLSDKNYWQHISPAPEFTVLFVPSDTFLDAAQRVDAGLLEFAFERDIVIATPSTLIALLRTIAYSWRQDALSKNAQTVLNLGRELHTRLALMGKSMSELGTALDRAVGKYNNTVGTLETRVLVSARRMAEVQGVTDALPTPTIVDKRARLLTAPALIASSTDAVVDIDADQRTQSA